MRRDETVVLDSAGLSGWLWWLMGALLAFPTVFIIAIRPDAVGWSLGAVSAIAGGLLTATVFFGNRGPYRLVLDEEGFTFESRRGRIFRYDWDDVTPFRLVWTGRYRNLPYVSFTVLWQRAHHGGDWAYRWWNLGRVDRFPAKLFASDPELLVTTLNEFRAVLQES